MVFERLKKSYETYQQLEQAANSSDKVSADDYGHEDDNNREIDMELDSLEAVENHEEVSDDEEDGELEDIEHMVAELETGWEPLWDGAPQGDAGDDEPVDIRSDLDTSNLDKERLDSDNLLPQCNLDRYIIGDGYGVEPATRILYTDKYPSSRAGKALSHEESWDCSYGRLLGSGDNPWAPFHSKKDWEIAQWVKLQGVGSTAFSELLAIDGVSFSQSSFAVQVKTHILKFCKALDLSYKNSDELNKIIDNKLPGRPQFKRHEIVQSDEAFEFYSWDIIECLHTLWGDPEFSDDRVTYCVTHFHLIVIRMSRYDCEQICSRLPNYISTHPFEHSSEHQYTPSILIYQTPFSNSSTTILAWLLARDFLIFSGHWDW